MIAVAQQTDNVWAISVTGEELTQMQGIADVLNTDIKGLISTMIAGGLLSLSQLTGDLFGNDGRN